MKTNLLDPSKFISPQQPPLIYDIKKSWEDIVQKAPIWKSGKFPPLSKEKKYSFLGKKLISPIIIAAGPASRHTWTDFYFKMGYGAVIEKTRRTSPRPSNTAPNIAIIHSSHLDKKEIGKPLTASMNPKDFLEYGSITNSFGNPSPSMDVWGPELQVQKKAVKDGQLLGCSITATIHNTQASMEEVAADLLMGAVVVATHGADFVELNLACPNVIENSVEGEMFQDEKLVAYTLAEFKRRFPNTPVGFKFGLYKSRAQMKKVFKAAGKNLDYVSGINAISNPVVKADGTEILPGRRTSGICGRLLLDIALESIQWASEIRKEEKLSYNILGGGGVTNPEDVDKFLKAGADAVQVATIALADPLLAYKYLLSKN